MASKFDFSNVQAASFGPPVFPRGRYTVELEKASHSVYENEAGEARVLVWVLFRLVGNRSYNNRTVLASRTLTVNTMPQLKGLMEHCGVTMPRASDDELKMARAIATSFNNEAGKKVALELSELDSELVIEALVS